MRLSFLTGLLFFLAIAFAGAQETGTIRGKVHSALSSVALADAHILITELGRSTRSDASGQYELADVPAGNYTLRFSFMGYAADSVRVKLSAGETLRASMTLFPAAYPVSGVVVSATRTERPIASIPAKVEVISQKDIEEMPCLTADDILNLAPGINVARNYGIFNKNTEVTMRGLNRNVYTLLLMDGVPLTLLDGSSANWNRIDPDNIDRIEIIKGPNSSLYGGNAIGGVINIITRKPSERFEGSAAAFYGTYRTLGGKAKLSGRTGHTDKKYWYGTADGFIRQSEGYIMDPDSLRDTNDAKLYVNEYHAGFKGGYAISPRESVEAEYRYSYDFRGAGRQFFEQGGNFNKYKTHNARARYSRITAKSQVEADVFWNMENYFRQNENIKTTGMYSFYHTYSATLDYGLWFSWSKVLPANQELTAGADIKVGCSDSKDVYHTSTDTVKYGGEMGFYGIFLQDQLAVFKGKMNITGGVRFDAVTFSKGRFEIASPSIATEYAVPYTGHFNDTVWFALSPHLGMQWNFSKDKRIFLSWSGGFRPSTLSDLCRTGDVNKGFKLANPGLSPETMDNIDLGAVLDFAGKISIEPTVFYSIGHNFQYFVGVGDSIDTSGFDMKPLIRRENIGEVHIYGAEFKFTWQIIHNLDFVFNYSYNLSRIARFSLSNYNGIDLTGLSLAEVPAHILYARLHWKNRFVNATVSAKYNDGEWADDANTQRTPSYYVIDLKLYRTFLKRLIVSLTAQNILNNRFPDSKGYLSPGRFIIGEVKVNF